MKSTKRKSRLPVQLPCLPCLWGLQCIDGVYSKLVVTLRTSEAPGAAQALARFGRTMTFVGDMHPTVTSILTAVGFEGHRNYSRIPLGDLQNLLVALPGMSFIDDLSQQWTIDQLEDIFGTCPIRSTNEAFTTRSVIFNFGAKIFPPLETTATQANAGLIDAMNMITSGEEQPQAVEVFEKGRQNTSEPTTKIGVLFESLRSFLSQNDITKAIEIVDELEPLITVS